MEIKFPNPGVAPAIAFAIRVLGTHLPFLVLTEFEGWLFDKAGGLACRWMSDLIVFLRSGVGRKVLGSHPGQVQVGDGHGMAAQGTL